MISNWKCDNMHITKKQEASMKTKLLTITLLILFATKGQANVETGISSAQKMKAQADAMLVRHIESKTDTPFELDPDDIANGKLSHEYELSLRMVRQALNKTPSNTQADLGKWICWYEKPVGSRLNKLNCARNGDIALSRNDTLSGGYISLTSKYIASRTMSRGKLEKILSALPGSDAYDQEFIALAMIEKELPKDIPSKKEIDQYAKAWIKVEKLYQQGKSEDTQIAAINAENMTLERYNRISEISETYASVMQDIAARVKQLR